MKKSTLKGILIAIVVAVLIGCGIAAASILERKSESTPEGAGTTTFPKNQQQEPELPASDRTLGDDDAALETADYAAQEQETVNIGGKEYRKNENISTLLLIGVDDMEIEQSPSYRNTAMADFLVLAVFDNAQKTCQLLQINRNTMTDVPMLGAMGDYIGLTTEQITYAHSYGDGLEESCENTVRAVSRFLYGVDIDNYLSLTMAAVAKLNDAVGGVTVTVEDDLTAVDETLVKGETVTLMGDQALHFVRSRTGLTDDRNTSRMRRQATYMTALVSKIREKMAADDAFILEMYNAVADYLVTDCNINELSEIGESLSGYSLGDIVTPEGETVQGKYAEFYVDEQDLQQLIADLFYIPAEEPAADSSAAPAQSAAPDAAGASRQTNG